MVSFFAAIFGAWTAIALFTGKFYTRFGKMADRREKPVSFWLLVTMTGGVTLFCIFEIVRKAISN